MALQTIALAYRGAPRLRRVGNWIETIGRDAGVGVRITAVEPHGLLYEDIYFTIAGTEPRLRAFEILWGRGWQGYKRPGR